MSIDWVQTRKPAVKSNNVWGFAWYVGSPWPEEVWLAYYDVGSSARKGSIQHYSAENGWADYKVIEKQDCDYRLQLLRSEYQVIDRKAVKAADLESAL